MAVQNINNYRRGRGQNTVVKPITTQQRQSTLPSVNQVLRQTAQQYQRNLQSANPANLAGSLIYTSQYGDEALADAKRRAAKGDVISQLYVNTAENILKPVQETYQRDSKNANPVVAFTSGLVQTLPNLISTIPAGLQAINLIQQGQQDVVKKGYQSIPGIVTDTVSAAGSSPLAFAGTVAGGAALGGVGAGRVSVTRPRGGTNTATKKTTPQTTLGTNNPSIKERVGIAGQKVSKKIQNKKPIIIVNAPGAKRDVVLGTDNPSIKERVGTVRQKTGKKIQSNKPIIIRNAPGAKREVVLGTDNPSIKERVGTVRQKTGGKIQSNKPAIIRNAPGAKKTPGMITTSDYFTSVEIPTNTKSVPGNVPTLGNTVIEGNRLKITDDFGNVLIEGPIPASMKGTSGTKKPGKSTPVKPKQEAAKQTSSSGSGNVLIMKDKGTSAKAKVTLSAPAKTPKRSTRVKISQLTTPKTKTGSIAKGAGTASLLNLPKTTQIKQLPEDVVPEDIVDDVIVDVIWPDGGVGGGGVNDTLITDTEIGDTDGDNDTIILPGIPLTIPRTDSASIQNVITIPVSETGNVNIQRTVGKTSSAASPMPNPKRKRRPDDDDEDEKKKKARKRVKRTYRQKVNPLPWLEDASDTSWLRKDLSFMRMPARVKVSAVRPALETYNDQVKAFNAARKKLRSTARETTAEGRKALSTLKRLYKAAVEARGRAETAVEKNRR